MWKIIFFQIYEINDFIILMIDMVQISRVMLIFLLSFITCP